MQTHFGLTANEQGTRFFFGKPYHWWREDTGLTLVPGYAPGESPKDLRTITTTNGLAKVGDQAVLNDGTQGTVTAVNGTATYMEFPKEQQ